MAIVRSVSTTKEEKLTSLDIEIGLGYYFNPRVNMLIPNVSWGFGIHECDVLVITKSGYLYEVEIKISASDLKKDIEKIHGHKSNRIKHLFFAIPWYLEPHMDYIPEHAGILSFRKGNRLPRLIRVPKTQSTHKVSNAELLQLYRLAALRVWPLKEANTRLKEDLARLKERYINE